MEVLKLALLGNPEIYRGGEPISTLRSRKAQALLTYLAVTGRPHLRQTLVGLLWGNMPEASARNNLSKALTQLRQTVGAHLDIGRQEIAFDRSCPYWLDVEQFERAILTTTGSTQPDIKRLASAIELYRGDFLEGFYVRYAPAFEEWSLAQRARLHELALQALYTLAVYYAGQGKPGWARGIDYTTRLLALEPWHEEAHRQLMLLLAQSGQRGAALAQYEKCQQILADALDVAPGTETTALYERIRDEKRSSEGIAITLPAFLRDISIDDHATTTFVAREREFEQLDGYLDAAYAGKASAVFVTGEAGSGKTTLIGAFTRCAQQKYPDLVVAEGICNAFTGSGDPYLPFREILGQLTGDVETRLEAGALNSESARRLWNLMPFTIELLVEKGPSLIGPLISGPALAARVKADAPGARWRDQLEGFLARDNENQRRIGVGQADLAAQLMALLTALSQRHPLLLIVDDLQWVDAGSVDLLFHLGRRLLHQRILVVGLYRPTEANLSRDGEQHPLAPLIREFQRKFGQMQVHLPQTGDKAFVDAFLDSEPNHLDRGFRNALYARTEGHALYTVEVLRDMQERGDVTKDADGSWVEYQTVDWALLPPRVKGVIGARIDRLQPALQETLKVACVEGETFTAEVAAQVQALPALDIVGRLSNELDRQHRLVINEGSQNIPGGKRTSRYRFRHALFQEYLYGRLDESERTYLHEAVANALECLYEEQTEVVTIQLARHFAIAGRADKAVGYYLQAGDRARKVYADVEARKHYAQALDILDRLPDIERNRRLRVDALTAHIECSWRTYTPQQALTSLTEAEQLLQQLSTCDEMSVDDRMRLARIYYWKGRVHHSLRSAYPEALKCSQKMQGIAQELEDAELVAIASSAIGRILTLQGRLPQAERLLGQAISALEQAGNWAEWLAAINYRGCALAMMGNYHLGLAEILRAHTWTQKANIPGLKDRNNVFFTGIYIHGGDIPHALEAARHGVEESPKSGRQLDVHQALFFQSWAAERAGQHNVAAMFAAKAQVIAQKAVGQLAAADWRAAVNAEIACGAGRIQEALGLAEQAVNLAQEVEGLFAEGIARRAWGKALAACSPPQWDQAEDQLAESLRVLEEGHARVEAARTHVAWGTVCHNRGDFSAARAHWEQAAAQLETSGLSYELEPVRALIQSLETG